MSKSRRSQHVAEVHEANRRRWNAHAPEWKRLRDADGLRPRCPSEPHLAFEGRALETIVEFVGELKGRKACVVGSGDNYAAFALAGLGMNVTSVDISEEQLGDAAAHASELGLDVRFVRADAADMPLAGCSFDLVCSTNGFLIWLADLSVVFSEIARILKPGGHYVFYDVHPFQRPWKDQVTPIETVKPVLGYKRRRGLPRREPLDARRHPQRPHRIRPQRAQGHRVARSELALLGGAFVRSGRR